MVGILPDRAVCGRVVDYCFASNNVFPVAQVLGSCPP